VAIRIPHTSLDRGQEGVVNKVKTDIEADCVNAVGVLVRVGPPLGQHQLVGVGVVLVEAKVGHIQVIQLIGDRNIAFDDRAGRAGIFKQQTPGNSVNKLAFRFRGRQVSGKSPGPLIPGQIQTGR